LRNGSYLVKPALDVSPGPGSLLTDPLLDKKARFYPLGLPLELNTNSEAILSAASESWSSFAERRAALPMQIHLGVAESVAHGLPAAPQFRSSGHLMSIVSDANNLVVCDFRRGYAFGCVSDYVANDPSFLRFHFLDAAALTLALQLYLAPLHGALIVRDDCGIALCGDSSAGKSTLAYAASRVGWTFVTDDSIYLLRGNSVAYGLGIPHRIRFRESAKLLFPELARYPAVRRSNGKVGLEISTSEFPISVAEGSQIRHVVFLNRNCARSAVVTPYRRSQAVAYWRQFVTCGEMSVRAEQMRCQELLLEAELWELQYSDFEGALVQLDALARCGRPIKARGC
jgi:hypothetical protein